MANRFAEVDEVSGRLAAVGYLPTPRITNVVFLADRLEKPILAGGPAGVGKTELAKARPLIVLTSNATRELSEALRRRCLERRSLDQATVDDALHLLLKHQRDLQRARAELRR